MMNTELKFITKDLLGKMGYLPWSNNDYWILREKNEGVCICVQFLEDSSIGVGLLSVNDPLRGIYLKGISTIEQLYQLEEMLWGWKKVIE